MLGLHGGITEEKTCTVMMVLFGLSRDQSGEERGEVIRRLEKYL
jgi:hypothetical protein